LFTRVCILLAVCLSARLLKLCAQDIRLGYTVVRSILPGPAIYLYPSVVLDGFSRYVRALFGTYVREVTVYG